MIPKTEYLLATSSVQLQHSPQAPTQPAASTGRGVSRHLVKNSVLNWHFNKMSSMRKQSTNHIDKAPCWKEKFLKMRPRPKYFNQHHPTWAE